MTKATYKRKHPIWGSGFQRVRVHDRHGREHGSRQSDIVLEQQLKAYILIHKNEAAGETLGRKWVFKTSKPAPSTHFLWWSHPSSPSFYLSSKHTFPNTLGFPNTLCFTLFLQTSSLPCDCLPQYGWPPWWYNSTGMNCFLLYFPLLGNCWGLSSFEKI